MRKFGLIGYPLTHSFSKKYFEEKFNREKIFDCNYELFAIRSIDEFPQLLRSGSELKGLNVTIPYKEAVIPFLNELDDTAKHVGAVNCIKITEQGTLGYNTDIHGFRASLQNFLTDMPQQAFILGTGGAAKAVKHVLHELSIPYVRVSRHPQPHCILYTEIEAYLKDVNLFVNTTPLGTFPDVNLSPAIPYDRLTPSDYLFDLVYNPSETLFLKKGKEKNSRLKNGLEMLQLQAEESWNIWNS